MRRAAKVDANQDQVVSALRAAGASVTSSAAIGKGFPDVVVGFRGVTYLLEIKDGNKPPSARELTPDQAQWHIEWRGHAVVVTSVDEALAAIGAIK